MPITLNCKCGKILRVADQHAGKRVKCPACQTIHTVPVPAPAPEAETEPEFEIIEPAPKTVPSRPVARPHVDDDYEEGEEKVGTYGLSKGGGGGRSDEDDRPRDQPLPDFRLGSGQRGKKRKKK
jgi:phage FluMu protein Com